MSRISTLSVWCCSSLMDIILIKFLCHVIVHDVRNGNEAGWGQVLPFPFPRITLIYLYVTLPILNRDEKSNCISVPMGLCISTPQWIIFLIKDKYFTTTCAMLKCIIQQIDDDDR